MTFDDKIVIYGMSCAGKTTFAETLPHHTYYCFDALFDWHLIETLGLSIEDNLNHLQEVCSEDDKFIIDGWHLSDPLGHSLPEGVSVYVIFATYSKIISQYRVPVRSYKEHAHMYRRWYSIDYDLLPNVTYLENCGEFKVRSREYYQDFIRSQLAVLEAPVSSIRNQ